MKIQANIALAFLFAIFSVQTFAQLAGDQIAGSWQGVLNTGAMDIAMGEVTLTGGIAVLGYDGRMGSEAIWLNQWIVQMSFIPSD